MLTWYMALLAVIWFLVLILSVLILVVFVLHLLQEKRLGVQLGQPLEVHQRSFSKVPTVVQQNSQ